MNKKDGIPFNGFQSVIEMLVHADQAFRARLLENVRRRDPHLARRLDSAMRSRIDQDGDGREALARGQRLAHTRNYGN